MRSAQRVFVGKLEGTQHELDNNIKANLQDLGRGFIDWLHLTKDRAKWQAFVNTVMSLRVSKQAGNCLNSWGTIKHFKDTLPLSQLYIQQVDTCIIYFGSTNSICENLPSTCCSFNSLERSVFHHPSVTVRRHCPVSARDVFRQLTFTSRLVAFLLQ